MNACVTDNIKKESKVSKEEWKEFTKSVWSIANVSHEIHPAMFPPEIPHRLTKLFSFKGETILDPFCGIGTTGRACVPLLRKFIGVDINGRYINIANKSLNSLSKQDFKIIHADSKNLDFVKTSSVGLIISSPPYWNKADYGKTKGNIGMIDNYKKFLENIEPIFKECFRILMPGRRMCIVTANVHQNTTDGLLTFPLAADYINICRDLGFRLVNEIIWSKDGTGGKWGSSGKQRPIFGSYPYPPNFLFKNVHEYILIFRKPDTINKNNPQKKLSYEKLMGLKLCKQR